jgi:hypothetical protein
VLRSALLGLLSERPVLSVRFTIPTLGRLPIGRPAVVACAKVAKVEARSAASIRVMERDREQFAG